MSPVIEREAFIGDFDAIEEFRHRGGSLLTSVGVLDVAQPLNTTANIKAPASARFIPRSRDLSA